MTYRNKTYIAGDWDNDRDAVDKLYEWNNSSYLILSFFDAHQTTQARDTSLCCSIKKSLKTRLDQSKTFVLIVGKNTSSLTKGSCQHCFYYQKSYYNSYCSKNHSINYTSYIQYECEQAIAADMEIIVLYNSSYINKSLCPEIIRNKGLHRAMKKSGDGSWDYATVKNALLYYI